MCELTFLRLFVVCKPCTRNFPFPRGEELLFVKAAEPYALLCGHHVDITYSPFDALFSEMYGTGECSGLGPITAASTPLRMTSTTGFAKIHCISVKQLPRDFDALFPHR